jgi:hypothetical protein
MQIHNLITKLGENRIFYGYFILNFQSLESVRLFIPQGVGTGY